MRVVGLLSFVFVVFAVLQGVVDAQEIAKVRDEYFQNPIRQYQPNDPWNRSFLYRLQTGHYGRFYNCDNEEQKRNSPYICWKNSDRQTIPKKDCLECINEEINKVKQRICDGAGPCCCGNQKVARQKECSCTQCVAQVHRPVQPIVRSNIFQSAEQPVVQRQACNCQECKSKANKLSATKMSANMLSAKVKQAEVLPAKKLLVAREPGAVTSNHKSNVVVKSRSKSNLLSRLKQHQKTQQPVVRQASVAPSQAVMGTSRR